MVLQKVVTVLQKVIMILLKRKTVFTIPSCEIGIGFGALTFSPTTEGLGRNSGVLNYFHISQ